jgi:hypothetical protein
MALASPPRPARSPADPDGRLRDLLALHCHPEHGSLYWLRRQEALGWDIRDRVRTLDDLWRVGPTPADDLRRFPLRDFIVPCVYHFYQRPPVLVRGEGGVPLRRRRPRVPRLLQRRQRSQRRAL